MSSTLVRRLVSAAAVTALAASPMLVPNAANAAPLGCKASVSNTRPQQYSNVTVRVKTAPKASVRTVAHYKTTKTAYNRKANNAGRANIVYYTASSTPGYRVRVNVTVKKNGKSRTCSTSFTARR